MTLDQKMEHLTEVVAELKAGDVSWTQLHGGLAHITYAAKTGAGDTYVVKFLTEEMDQFGLMVPMQHLIHNTISAGECGVGARVLHSCPEIPAIVMEFIDGRTLTTADLSEATYIPRIGRSVRKLHDEASAFSNDIDIFIFLERYLGLVEEHSLKTPEGLLDSLETIRRVQEALAVNELPSVPSNNDLLALNIMDDGMVRLIDYDFSGMNDPMFDLGDVAMEGDYDPAQLRVLCDAYFGEHEPVQYARARLFGVVAQYTWSLLFVGMDRLLTDMPAETFDYWAEGQVRWDWTRSQLNKPDLEDTIMRASS
ncbi:MAG: hypothetical protein QOH80_2109 [Actinomycetota bacterium]|nr:hypothetical protein [Actinomycetota bacterium]